MLLNKRNVRNQLLSELQSAIEHQTHGRLSRLSLDVIDEAPIIEAHSETYYTVQLALAAINTFMDEHPMLPPAMMVFCVNGHPLVSSNPHIKDTNAQLTSNGSFDDDDSFVVSHHNGNSLSSRVSPAVDTATAS